MIKVTPANPRLDSGSSFEDFDDDVEADDNRLQVPDLDVDEDEDDYDDEFDEQNEDLLTRAFLRLNIVFWQLRFRDLIFYFGFCDLVFCFGTYKI